MELGQSTVLGLAIVGDDGGVDDPAFESVRGRAPELRLRRSLTIRARARAAAVDGGRGQGRPPGGRRGAAGGSRPRQLQEQGTRHPSQRRRVAPSPPEPGVSAARVPGVDDVPPGGGEVQLAGDRVNVRCRAHRLFSHAPLTQHALCADLSWRRWGSQGERGI